MTQHVLASHLILFIKKKKKKLAHFVQATFKLFALGVPLPSLCDLQEEGSGANIMFHM